MAVCSGLLTTVGTVTCGTSSSPKYDERPNASAASAATAKIANTTQPLFFRFSCVSSARAGKVSVFVPTGTSGGTAPGDSTWVCSDVMAGSASVASAVRAAAPAPLARATAVARAAALIGRPRRTA